MNGIGFTVNRAERSSSAIRGPFSNGDTSEAVWRFSSWLQDYLSGEASGGLPVGGLWLWLLQFWILLLLREGTLGNASF